MNKKTFKNSIQNFGKFLSGMVMPNIGAFIAWGFLTALFIADGWFPNERLATLVDPMLNYLLPLLIGYTGGYAIAEKRGAVIGAIATMGVIVGADIPMLIGAMIMGPLAAALIKYFDKMVEGKIKAGFEMLVNNFSIGILGMLLAILAYYIIGPFIVLATNLVEEGVSWIVNKNLLPLASIFIEPAKVLFLNNAVNHGVLTPIGLSDVEEAGKSIMFLIETNPGPGLGVLLAYSIFGKGSSKQSAPGAIIVQFFGGIHEIYFPYILMNPLLIIAVILGGAAGVLTFSLLGAGLVAAASPGSIFAILALAPKGGMLAVILGVLVAAVVSFLVSSLIIKTAKEEGDLEKSKEEVKNLKNSANNTNNISPKNTENIQAKSITTIVFACDAGMGSSAMGASRFKERIKHLELDISVTNTSVDNIKDDAQIVVTHENLVSRIKNNNIEIIPIKNFLKDPNLDELYNRIELLKK